MSLGVSVQAGLFLLRHIVRWAFPCRCRERRRKRLVPSACRIARRKSEDGRGISYHCWKKSRANVKSKPETKRAADFSAALRHKYELLFSLTGYDLPESARNCRDFSRSQRRAARETRNVHPRGP